ncbi:MAG: hypothetical protein AAFV43_12950 [Planctomycetota bacterium]
MSEAEDSKPSGPGLMGLIKAVVIVCLLVVVEIVAASMLIPSAADTEELARELARATSGDEFLDDATDDSSTLNEGEETSEVELGSFNITRFDPENDTTLNVDFTVYGVVLATEQATFVEAYDANVSRIQEQIVMTMHAAKTTDLTTAGLGLIKRQILEKTNRAVGKPLLREVVFTKLNFVQR